MKPSPLSLGSYCWVSCMICHRGQNNKRVFDYKGNLFEEFFWPAGRPTLAAHTLKCITYNSAMTIHFFQKLNRAEHHCWLTNENQDGWH